MSLEVTAGHTRTIRVSQEKATTDIQVDSILMGFNEDAPYMAIKLLYGDIVDSKFKRSTTETWLLSGPPLKQIMSMDAKGTTRVAVTRDLVADIVRRVQTTPDLREQLLASGDLTVGHIILSEINPHAE
jgi:hypothetical protein